MKTLLLKTSFHFLSALGPKVFPARTFFVILADFSTRPTMFNAYLLQTTPSRKIL